ncbi:YneF family protein [Lentilactobacillus parafarraginis]|uniref:UPF0154 protein FEZ41_00990 n=2 Tax=Lentilactobacillus parafarraginis TaxID=390842 RepID=A0A5R9CYH4_9LACO|nr:YneF family protein [Lentilactobacillus parafarraginis]EHL95789.1 hypothetical protein HMPREF9103_02745 [Lentilactobacillus parafarraginis F0439]TLQ20975.1 YneF family protein [Lentilactobacillus parafarraginis]
MATWIWILIVIVALIIGLVGGFYGARKYMEKYLKENPPFNEDQLRQLMLQMGQKPSQKKLNQMMHSMQSNVGKK